MLGCKMLLGDSGFRAKRWIFTDPRHWCETSDICSLRSWPIRVPHSFDHGLLLVEEVLVHYTTHIFSCFKTIYKLSDCGGFWWVSKLEFVTFQGFGSSKQMALESTARKSLHAKGKVSASIRPDHGPTVREWRSYWLQGEAQD